MNTCWNKAPILFQCAQGALSISEILLHQNPAIYENRKKLEIQDSVHNLLENDDIINI